MTDGGGALLFARFAFPPNELGYCGPAASAELFERTSQGDTGRGLRELARGFDGAWPYLELIAAANGIADPLDRRVVEAYWIGNSLLDRVAPRELAMSLLARFGRRVPHPERMLDPVLSGAVAHHAFHVFGVYPWVGMLRTGRVDEPLRVLDRCRIRWGRVEAVATDTVARTDTAFVMVPTLRWRDGRLELGAAVPETVTVGRDGRRLTPCIRAGDWCALHWDWLCQPLTSRQLAALRRYTRQQLDAVNSVAQPAPAQVLA